jgi:hypothetical protein
VPEELPQLAEHDARFDLKARKALLAAHAARDALPLRDERATCSVCAAASMRTPFSRARSSTAPIAENPS